MNHINLDQFHRLTLINRDEGWEKAKAAFPEIDDATLEAFREAAERARVLRPLMRSVPGRRVQGPFALEAEWVAAMNGGAEWTALRARLAAAGQLRGG